MAMINLNLDECLSISGGLNIGGVQFYVPATGIPSYDYVRLDYAFSMFCNDAWSRDQAYDYLLDCGSVRYIEKFEENLDSMSY